MQPISDETTAQVRAAYQWILGREPDPAGLRDNGGAIDRGEIDLPTFRRVLLESTEFRQARRSLATVDIGYGISAVIDPNESEFGRHIAANGTWEPHIVETIRGNLKRGDTFIDVGGNVGLMSFYAADVVGPEGKVIAFEPNPRNVACFRRGIAANDFSSILLYPFGASDDFRLLVTTTASNAKVASDSDPLTGHDVGQAVPIDFIVRGEPRVDLIKMDIEGYELPAFRGMAETLRLHRPLVLTEFNPLCLRSPGGIEPGELAAFIFSVTDTVAIVEHDASQTEVRSAAALMALWAERDAANVAAGRLPAGWTHFDLLFRPR